MLKNNIDYHFLVFFVKLRDGLLQYRHMAITIPDFTFEREYCDAKGGDMFLIGVDEAGRGPLAGPVVAAAARYRRADFSVPQELEKSFAFIRDSKTLSEKKREAMFDVICEHFDIGIGIIHPETIDRINILQATFLAMKEAVGDLQRKLRGRHRAGAELYSGPQVSQIQGSGYDLEPADILLLIDGNQKVPNLSLSQETVVGGDRIVKSIAAASIAAKVTRDRMMDEYDALYPQYGFKKHKGYGTKAHMDALQKHGPTPVHRLSFAPVEQAVRSFRELGILA